MFAHLLDVSRSLLPRLLPSSCVLCGQTGRDVVCQPCRQRHVTPPPHRCMQCAMPMSGGDREIRCGDCLNDKPAFDATIVAADYAAPVDQLVLALKFGACLPLAASMAGMLWEAIAQHHERSVPLPALLTAVPLGALRLRERGFNQSLEIARPLARRLKTPLEPHLLARLRDTLPQSTLPHGERQRNIRRAFVVPSAAIKQVRGAHIGVIDDVITTGDTLDEIAATLKRAGAQRVTNIVFARTA